MSRKHIAGGCARRLCRPAAASCISTPSMMFSVQARACWRWYMAITERSVRALIRSPSWPPRIASGRTPCCVAGPITSACHMTDSVSAIRRMLSLCVRTICWIEPMRMPAAAASRSGRRTELLVTEAVVRMGRDRPRRLANEHQRSTGSPVRSAISANVPPPSAENRSNAWASRKSSVTVPLRMAAPSPSRGCPT